MLYGYSELARQLNERLVLPVPVRPQQIYAWHTRHVKNKAGQVFPAPKASLPGRQWDLHEVLDWAMAGVPGRDGHGWRVPQPRGNADEPICV